MILTYVIFCLYIITCILWGLYAMQEQYKNYESSPKKCLVVGILHILLCPVMMVFVIYHNHQKIVNQTTF